MRQGAFIGFFKGLEKANKIDLIVISSLHVLANFAVDSKLNAIDPSAQYVGACIRKVTVKIAENAEIAIYTVHSHIDGIGLLAANR